MMVMYQHPVNYYHFAKLWVAQLVAMCRGETTVTPETGHLDDTHQLMAELRKTDPVKCKKLAARLVTPGNLWKIDQFQYSFDFFCWCQVRTEKNDTVCALNKVTFLSFKANRGLCADVSNIQNLDSFFF